MIKIIAVIAAVATLAGCQATANVDSTIQSNLPRTCALIETSHAAFAVLAATGQISRKTANAEMAAYTSTRAICANPQSATAADALITAASAYATISSALGSARKKKRDK